jgi:hypothetical protein
MRRRRLSRAELRPDAHRALVHRLRARALPQSALPRAQCRARCTSAAKRSGVAPPCARASRRRALRRASAAAARIAAVKHVATILRRAELYIHVKRSGAALLNASMRVCRYRAHALAPTPLSCAQPPSRTPLTQPFSAAAAHRRRHDRACAGCVRLGTASPSASARERRRRRHARRHRSGATPPSASARERAARRLRRARTRAPTQPSSAATAHRRLHAQACARCAFLRRRREHARRRRARASSLSRAAANAVLLLRHARAPTSTHPNVRTLRVPLSSLLRAASRQVRAPSAWSLRRRALRRALTSSPRARQPRSSVCRHAQRWSVYCVDSFVAIMRAHP